VSSDFSSEPGNTLNLKYKFLPFLACLPFARAHLHMPYYPSHALTCVCLLLIYSSTSHFRHVLLLFSPFATMVCVPPSPPLCVKFGNTALILASREGHTATVELLLGAGADKDAKTVVRET